MAERLSTGFADALNVTGCVKDIMANSYIDIYSGTQPVSADAVETGVLLMTLTLNSGAFTPGVATNGLNMGLSTGGILAKAADETWSGVGTAAAGSTGTLAGWFRWRANDDVPGASTTAIRLDGSVGTSTTNEMQMSNTNIVDGVAAVVQTFNYTTTKS